MCNSKLLYSWLVVWLVGYTAGEPVLGYLMLKLVIFANNCLVSSN